MSRYDLALEALQVKVGRSEPFKLSKTLLVSMVLLFSAAFSAIASAADIYDLQRSGDVELVAWVGEKPKSGDKITPAKVSVNEQVILTIEVATPRWLTGGTRIGSIEIPNVIAKQRNQLATNYTERVGGTTWSRQRWEVTLYPMTSGEFVIPTVPVRIQVSAPDGSNVGGTLYTQPIKFEASLPSGLLSDESPWFSATDVDVEQQWQRSNENLKVGDAITRTVTIKAKDSLSVLLPDVLSNESTQQYQAYPQPKRLDDTQERGDYRSSRVEETVYVIQQGGEFTLPDFSFQWWDSKNQRLESVVIKGEVFEAKHTLQSFIKAYMSVFISVGLALVLCVAFVVSVKRYYKNRPTPSWLIFRRLLKQGNWSALRTFIYRELRTETTELELGKAQLGNLNGQKRWVEDSEALQQGREDKNVFARLWRGLRNLPSDQSNSSHSRSIFARLKIPKALSDLKDRTK
ncbi:BatD family protein [Vibrio crassostreae]|uniref:Oxygen tolerance protein BatD n=1 Tax=Vibrio crassostreae TaxID=246167 RepID=A0ABP1X5M0_9VIBR|nr:BatD family protein [Vibrio crassostreae]ROS66277.1 oxygen tolerance protein BatD [Vibrio crassostreae]TCL28365.1 oxygen tolerance protein BatD [Vibrio crassostreae]TCT41477.1 oxygen tolerance protein BatD [Vibrio crassostreae]TCT50617.1 oxygen tolerance protein BatD [Vibrio crassostreae]TCT59693.1 oxygen tolerance protein BatD [Vibrio crassostreae]